MVRRNAYEYLKSQFTMHYCELFNITRLGIKNESNKCVVLTSTLQT